MKTQNDVKQNVSVFNENVQKNGGFLNATNASFSSRVANKRITDSIYEYIRPTYKTLVDIGCGDGVYTNEIKHNFPNLSVEGFDSAFKAIKEAQERFPGVKFSVRNILDDNIPLFKKKFDVGVIRGVLHHLTDREKGLRNAFKLTSNPIIMQPNGNNPVLKLIEKTSRHPIEHEEQSFLSTTLSNWIRNAGGEITDFQYVGYAPFFFPTAPAKVIYFFQLFLEKLPVVKHIFSAQFIIAASKRL